MVIGEKQVVSAQKVFYRLKFFLDGVGRYRVFSGSVITLYRLHTCQVKTQASKARQGDKNAYTKYSNSSCVCILKQILFHTSPQPLGHISQYFDNNLKFKSKGIYAATALILRPNH